MHPLIRHHASALLRVVLLGTTAAFLAGCSSLSEPPKKPQSNYPDKGLRPGLPPYLKDTILERTDLGNTGPLAVTSFGLVVNLRYSGDSTAPVPVREWMIKEMIRHGFGMHNRIPGYKQITPEGVLADKRTAIVMVGAYVPPGARKGQRTDVVVQAMPGNDTASLSGGSLYQCDLRVMGANPWNPGGAVNPAIQARGPIFINPVFALEIPKAMDANGRAGARIGSILGGGICVADRELHLRMRTPQWNISRAIEAVINQRFQADSDKPRLDGRGMCSAEAQDEGYLHLYVPKKYQGNWQHFVGVVQHLYINLSPPQAALKSQELASEARKPGAMLENISYSLEGLGPVAIPAIRSLLVDPRPDVSYAAARAGAFLADSPSEDVLIRIAQTPSHPYRLHAVQSLAELPYNAEIARAMAACLDSDHATVRVEAYRVLSKNQTDRRIPSPIVSMTVGNSFILDVVDSKAAPLIYAARTGEPRLAILGPRISLQPNSFFRAFDSQLTIAAHPTKPNLISIFYRGDDVQIPVQTVSRPLVAELVARLGGATEDKLHFGYSEIIAMLQSFVDSGKLSSALVLQDLPGMDDFTDFTDSAGAGRPTGDPATRPSQAGVNSGGPGDGSPKPRPN